MPLPNFLIVGPPKCGTTSLYQYLNQHPEVFFSEYKEPNYFALAGEKLPKPGPVPPEIMYQLIYSRSIMDFDKYQAAFTDAGEDKAIGDASVRYLYFEKAPERIQETIPDVKMIAILREPVSRLYSHYCMNVQYQVEPLGLEEAIMAEDERVAADWGWDWHYVRIGRYAEQLKRYFKLFAPGQLKVFLHDDFIADPGKMFREVCDHIGIDATFEPDISGRGKVAYRGRNLALDRWLHWPSKTRRGLQKLLPGKASAAVMKGLKEWNRAEVPKLDPELRATLGKKYFEKDLPELADLLGREIPWKY